MARWIRLLRGMLGTGLTFAAATGTFALLVGSVMVLLGRGAWLPVFRTTARFSVAGFLLGLGFAGLLALTARSRRFAELSLPRFMALGGAAGLVYFGLISINGYGVWSPATALLNFVLLTGLGAGSAAGVLLVARRARGELEGGEDRRLLTEE